MTQTRRKNLLIILILGAMSTVSPFSIDMYLPAFPQIAQDLGTTPSAISLSVSGYFVGLALGQLFYGPLLDRFGRKPPLYAGLSVFALASLGCALVRSPTLFIALRLAQALGGCVAQVGAVTMVRDFFPAEDSARVLSLLVLVLSVSPLFAPSLGSVVTTSLGWPWIFVVLAAFALFVIAVTALLLPQGHRPDTSLSLHPGAILRGFGNVISRRQFATYAVGGAFSFAGLFVYVTGSPIIFIDKFHVGPHAYGLIFAGLACGFIGGSQLNHWLSRRHRSAAIFTVAALCQTALIAVLVIGALNDWYGLTANIVLLLLYLPFCGLAYPNAAATALSPFTRNVGSAAALLGFLQMGIGALASAGIGLLHAADTGPIYAVMAATAITGFAIVLADRWRGGGQSEPSGSQLH
jgi:MFS transporter, DHA1 family, multidrug resistance protein